MILRRNYGAVILSLLIVFMLIIGQMVFAQEATPLPPDDPAVLAATQMVVDATNAAIIQAQAIVDATNAAQAAMDAFNTNVFSTDASINATATADSFAAQTATARPTSTPPFPPISAVLNIEPLNTSGSYLPGDELTFRVRITNGGTTYENRLMVVGIVYDTQVFSAPVEGSISPTGETANGSVLWQLEEGLFPGEESTQEFIFKVKARSDLRTSAEGTVQAFIRNRGEVMLTQTDVMRVPIVVQGGTSGNNAVVVPQGEGLFRSEGSFSALVGIAFGLAAIMTVGLSTFVIYKVNTDDIRDQILQNTVEVLLLLVVLFSVIVMGVQNAIDRESINAIIGGIVGYVAGRARTGISRGGAAPTRPTPTTTPPAATAALAKGAKPLPFTEVNPEDGEAKPPKSE